MFKLSISKDLDNLWYYSFYTINTEHQENNHNKYYINFPFCLALKCLVSKDLSLGYIYGPEFCNNCSRYGTINNKIVSLCCNCTIAMCKDSLEEFKCECNLNIISHQNEFNIKNINYKNKGICEYGCSMRNCIFKTYLKNMELIDDNLSISMSKLIENAENYNSSICSIKSLIEDSNVGIGIELMDEISILSEIDDLQISYVSSSRTITSDTTLFKKLNIIDLVGDDIDGEIIDLVGDDIDGEIIVYNPRFRSRYI
jgi:hypothetical protein